MTQTILNDFIMKTSSLTFFLIFFSNLFGQNFYEKYHIDQFMSSADLTKKQKAFKAFKSHLDDLGFMYDKSFTYEYESALGFNDRLPKYPFAAAHYRDVRKAQKAIPISLISGFLAPIVIFRFILLRNRSFINSIEAYSIEKAGVQLDKSKSPWQQNTQEQNPWD